MGYVPTGGGGGASIGGSVSGATAGSVFFAGAAGVLAQDNANFFYDDTKNQLQIRATGTNPPLSLTESATDLYQRVLEVKRSNNTDAFYIWLDGNASPVYQASKTHTFWDSANSYVLIQGNDYSATEASLKVRTVVTTKPGIEIALAGSQSADAFQVKNSGGTTLTSILASGAISMTEQTAPSAPSANGVYLYAEDNGSGKTRLMALFPTGAAQQVAIEP